VKPAAFVVPLGPVIPIAAILIGVTILTGATSTQLVTVAAACVAGAVLYQIAVRNARREPRPVILH
jgi:ABC-type uncharacterized transport system permease subunit